MIVVECFLQLPKLATCAAQQTACSYWNWSPSQQIKSFLEQFTLLYINELMIWLCSYSVLVSDWKIIWLGCYSVCDYYWKIIDKAKNKQQQQQKNRFFVVADKYTMYYSESGGGCFSFGRTFVPVVSGPTNNRVAGPEVLLFQRYVALLTIALFWSVVDTS